MDIVYNGHIKSTETLNKTELKIPSDKNLFLVVVFTPAILVWLIVEIYIFPRFIFATDKTESTLLIWIFGWTAFGIFAIRMWLWHGFGQTKISIQNNTLTIRKKNDIFSKQKVFELDKIQNLHIQNRDVEKTKYFTKPNYLLTDKTRTIAFLYEQRIIRVIDWLNVTDANFVFSKLKSKVFE